MRSWGGFRIHFQIFMRLGRKVGVPKHIVSIQRIVSVSESKKTWRLPVPDMFETPKLKKKKRPMSVASKDYVKGTVDVFSKLALYSEWVSGAEKQPKWSQTFIFSSVCMVLKFQWKQGDHEGIGHKYFCMKEKGFSKKEKQLVLPLSDPDTPDEKYVRRRTHGLNLSRQVKRGTDFNPDAQKRRSNSLFTLRQFQKWKTKNNVLMCK